MQGPMKSGNRDMERHTRPFLILFHGVWFIQDLEMRINWYAPMGLSNSLGHGDQVS